MFKRCTGTFSIDVPSDVQHWNVDRMFRCTRCGAVATAEYIAAWGHEHPHCDPEPPAPAVA